MAGSASLLWAIAGLVGLVTVAPTLDKAIESKASSPASGGFQIERSPDGQFYTDASAGQVAIRLMVDSGSDKVLLAGPDAERLGFPTDQGFTNVTLAELAVGPHRVRNVAAVIAPDLPVSLLGQSFLSRLSHVDLERDRMLLR